MLVVCSDIHVLGSKLMSAEATRMQDLASEFSKISGWHPGPPQRERATISSTHHQPGKRPGVGTQTLVPLNFSAVVAPLVTTASDLSLNRHVSSRDKFLLAPPLEASSSYTVGEDAGLFLGHIARRLLQLGYIGGSRITTFKVFYVNELCKMSPFITTNSSSKRWRILIFEPMICFPEICWNL